MKRISYMYTCVRSLWTSLETILPFWVITEYQAELPVLYSSFPLSSVPSLSRVSLRPHGLQYARLPCPSATSFLLASYFVHGCVFISYPISQFIPASWDLSSPIRDGACTPCIGSTESLPMGLHQSFPFLNGVSLGFQELHVSPFSRSGLKPQHHPLALSLPYCQPHITFQAC